jgi:hypothetical protein
MIVSILPSHHGKHDHAQQLDHFMGTPSSGSRPTGGIGMRLANLTIDLRPLRTSRDLRLLLASRAITSLGSQITMVAALVQVAQLTGSAVAVGLLGAAELLPIPRVQSLWRRLGRPR